MPRGIRRQRSLHRHVRRNHRCARSARPPPVPDGRCCGTCRSGSFKPGRVAAYTFAGAALGAAGSGLTAIAGLLRVAGALRLAAGALLVLVALRMLTGHTRMAFIERGGRAPLAAHLRRPCGICRATPSAPGCSAFAWGFIALRPHLLHAGAGHTLRQRLERRGNALHVRGRHTTRRAGGSVIAGVFAARAGLAMGLGRTAGVLLLSFGAWTLWSIAAGA